MRTMAMIILIIVAGVVWGTTFIIGEVSGEWDAEHSPYLVNGTITVPPGESLVIQPGTQVVFETPGQLVVDSGAVFKAVGTPEDSIRFEAEINGWYGIKFLNASDACTLAYVTITGAIAFDDTDYLNSGGAVYVKDCSPAILHARIYGNSAGKFGGGITLVHSEATVAHCIISDNRAELGGGGISVHQMSIVTLEDNTITSNSTNDGGAGIAIYYSTATITNSNISNNTNSGGNGGGIFAALGTCDIINNEISNNSAQNGAGIYTISSDFIIRNNTISSNIANENGGGIMDSASTITADNNQFLQNTAVGGFGGAIALKFSENATVSSNEFSRNSSATAGGAVYATWTTVTLEDNIFRTNNSEKGGAIAAIRCDRVEILHNTAQYNRATFGGAIYTDSSAVTITANKISDNSATNPSNEGNGGGIWIANADLIKISTNILSGNQSSFEGGAVYITGSRNPVIISNTIVGNEAQSGGGLLLENTFAIPVNNIIFGNNAEVGGEMYVRDGTVCWAHNLVDCEEVFTESANLIDCLGNFDDDPDFADDEFNLSPESPCIDAGTDRVYVPELDTTIYVDQYDVNGLFRPQGAGYDIGAVEFATSGVEEFAKPTAQTLTTYPNPFNGAVQISAATVPGTHTEILVRDLNGRMVARLFNGVSHTEHISARWTPENLPSGTYVVTVKSGDTEKARAVEFIR